MSGGLVRQKMKYERFLRKRMNSNPKKGPIHFRAPSRIFWRTVRGCVLAMIAYPTGLAGIHCLDQRSNSVDAGNCGKGVQQSHRCSCVPCNCCDAGWSPTRPSVVQQLWRG